MSKEEKMREEIEGRLWSKCEAGLDQQIDNIVDAEREEVIEEWEINRARQSSEIFVEKFEADLSDMIEETLEAIREGAHA
jgi:hypothetical protein